MKQFSVAAAALLALTACDSQSSAPTPAPKAMPAPAPIETPKAPGCSNASLTIVERTGVINFNQKTPSLTIDAYNGRMRVEPAIVTPDRPQYSGPAYTAWKAKDAANQAILKAPFAEQATYAVNKLMAACKGLDPVAVQNYYGFKPTVK